MQNSRLDRDSNYGERKEDNRQTIFPLWEDVLEKDYISVKKELDELEVFYPELTSIISNMASMMNDEDKQEFLEACRSNSRGKIDSLFSRVTNPIREQGYILSDNGRNGIMGRNFIRNLYMEANEMDLPKTVIANGIYNNLIKGRRDPELITNEGDIDEDTIKYLIMLAGIEPDPAIQTKFFNNLYDYLHRLYINNYLTSKHILRNIIIPTIILVLDGIANNLSLKGRFESRFSQLLNWSSSHVSKRKTYM